MRRIALTAVFVAAACGVPRAEYARVAAEARQYRNAYEEADDRAREFEERYRALVARLADLEAQARELREELERLGRLLERLEERERAGPAPRPTAL